MPCLSTEAKRTIVLLYSCDKALLNVCLSMFPVWLLHAWLLLAWPIHAWHMVNYMRCVCSTPWQNVFHTQTRNKDTLKFSHSTTLGRMCKNEVIIKQCCSRSLMSILLYLQHLCLHILMLVSKLQAIIVTIFYSPICKKIL